MPSRSESTTQIGKIQFDKSSQEAEVFGQLFGIIKKDRAGLGEWLWYLGDQTTLDENAIREIQRTDIEQPERIAKSQWLIENIPVDSAEKLQTYMEGKSKDRTQREFYPVFQQDGRKPGKVVGCMSFGGSGDEREMHFWIDPDFRGQGIMKKAHDLAEKYLYNDGVRTLVSSAEIDNASSRRALQKIYGDPSSSTYPNPPVWRRALKNEKIVSTDMDYKKELKDPQNNAKAPSAKDIFNFLRCSEANSTPVNRLRANTR